MNRAKPIIVMVHALTWRKILITMEKIVIEMHNGSSAGKGPFHTPSRVEGCEKYALKDHKEKG